MSGEPYTIESEHPMTTKQQELLTMESEPTPVRASVPDDANPLSTFQALVADGVDPEKLGKLLDLQERWERGQAEKAYAAAMKACKSELPLIVKDKVNTDTNKRYPSLEGTSSQINDIILKHGFTLSFGSESCEAPNYITITCLVRHEAGHSELHKLPCPYDMTGPKGGANKTPIQGMGSSISYGRRYLKFMIFDLTVAGEDKDGNQPKESISDEEVGELNDLIASAAEATAQMPADILNKVLDAFRINSLDLLPKMQLGTAKRRLTKTIQSGGR